MHGGGWIVRCIVLLFFLGSNAIARADTEILSFEKVAPPVAPDGAWRPTGLRARVKCPLPYLRAPDFRLAVTDADPPVELPAKASVSFKDTSEPMALVVVVQGNERFMGNASLVEADGVTPREPTDGAYRHVKEFLDRVARVGPAGARGALIAYGEKVTIKLPMGPLSALTAESLGPEKDYWWVGAKQLKNALEQAFQELSREPGRKVLVVVGDGDDVNSAVKIDDTIVKLKGLGVEVYALHYAPRREISGAGPARMRALGQLGLYAQAVQGDELADKAGVFATDIDSLYVVEFDGNVLPADDLPHDYRIHAKNLVSDERTIALPKPPPAPPPPRSSPWPWIVGGSALALATIGAIAWIVRRRRAARSASDVIAPPEVVATAPPIAKPASAASPRTVFIPTLDRDDDTPNVAWLVPLNGPKQWSTFKMNPGRTTIGTAPDCHVVIDDDTVSSHHCEIVGTPVGFTIHDKGSTNGVIVNSRRVPTHELVDNDTLTLGRTDFRFKSTT